MQRPTTTLIRDRRTILGGAAAAALAVTVGAARIARGAKPKPDDEDEVSATEDLMREHGILRRVLLIYGDAVTRLDARQEVKPDVLAHAAEIIKAFIEDYHERDEEQFIFPRFIKAGKMVDLVTTLQRQHQAGRKLTADILRLATAAGLANQANWPKLAESMRLFVRMYEPHAVREDTVLFPAFRELVGPKELDKLKDVFEEKEKALPGGGFEQVVVQVEKLEQAVGLAELAKFTPKIP